MEKKSNNPDKARRKILDLLSIDEFRAIRRNDMVKRLKIHPGKRVEFRHLLSEMVGEGLVLRVKSGRYMLPRKEELVTGVLLGNRKGFGFVKPLDKTQPDIYIHRENMSTAFDGDSVLVRIMESVRKRGMQKDLGPEGKIVEIVKRKNKRIAGTLQRSGNLHYVVPDNLAIFNDIIIDPSGLKGAAVGDKVTTRITEWSSKHLGPVGTIVKVLGSSRDFSSEIKAVIEGYELPGVFPKTAREQASGITADITKSELGRRVDYRDQELFTIDPENARDFDDAVSLTYDTKKKTYRLGVHIADVAYYVPEGSPLDIEAVKRGNSYYLANTVIPMLPKKLANNLCSLKPGVARLTMSVIMDFTDDGMLLGYRIHESVIKSKKRFSYEQVMAIIDGKEKSPYAPTIRMMSEFSQVLRERRRDRGSVTFNMPEIEAVVGQDGEIEEIRKHTGDASHSLIEEFMLAANETVAVHLTEKERPVIYRIHNEPDVGKITNLVETALHFRYRLPKAPTRFDIQGLLDQVEGKPAAYLINLAYLKTMKLAEYSTVNVGHFGLASEGYVHFTSPIRRYPDLTIHRSLKQKDGRKADITIERLQAIAESCSETDRNAANAEKAVRNIAVLRYLHRTWKAKKRRIYKGLITEINSMGMVIYLDRFLFEGILKLSSLVSDYFRINKERRRLEGVRTHKTYSVGEEIPVMIKQVDLIGRELELMLARGSCKIQSKRRRK